MFKKRGFFVDYLIAHKSSAEYTLFEAFKCFCNKTAQVNWPSPNGLTQVNHQLRQKVANHYVLERAL